MRLNHSPDIFDWIEAVEIVEVKIENTVEATENPQQVIEDNWEEEKKKVKI